MIGEVKIDGTKATLITKEERLKEKANANLKKASDYKSLDEFLLNELKFTNQELAKFLKKFTKKESKEVTLENTILAYNYLKERNMIVEGISKLIKAVPKIVLRDMCYINDKITLYSRLGFNEEEINYLVSVYPKLFESDALSILDKLDFLLKQNYDKEELKQVCLENPNVILLSNKTMKAKKEFYGSIGLLDAMNKNPRSLVQPKDITEGRLIYLNSINKDIKENNYHDLFSKRELFEEKYNVNQDDLLEIVHSEAKTK